MRVLAVFALLLLGCAVEVDSDPAASEPAPTTDAPALDARAPAQKSSSTCAPVLDTALQLQGWLCAPPRLIDPGDDFDGPKGELTVPSNPLADREPVNAR